MIVVGGGVVAAGASAGNAGLGVPSHGVPLAAPGVLSTRLRWGVDGGAGAPLAAARSP